MKLLTVLGTRPEIIRLSVIIKRLDHFCEQILVHTGQNYAKQLSDVFFRELEVRAPDINLGIETREFATQVGQILSGVDRAIDEQNPDRMVILGDTNSGLAAIVAARRGVPVYHLEAGNRCYDDRVPEEINRRIIDHCSSVLMPYTHRSKENLLREGIARDRIFVIGNPIYEVCTAHASRIDASDIVRRLGLETQRYFLATVHRAENVDVPDRLRKLFAGIAQVAATFEQPVVVSLHPRTADKLRRFGIAAESPHVRLLDPMGFVDFVALERSARCVISDSGTVQEECCIFHVPNVTVRDVTERPETIECGSNTLTGADPEMIVHAVRVVLNSPSDWTPPAEYLEQHVSTQVTKIVLGYESAHPRVRDDVR